MKLKRILPILLAVLLMVGMILPIGASAMITTFNGTVDVLPGNTQSSSPDYSYAWLDNMILRDDVNAVTSAKMVPKPAYPYSKTYEEFVHEVDQYSALGTIDETTAAAAYDEICTTVYYVVTALGMTDDHAVMREYLSDYGITLPANETDTDKIHTAVVYSALKYNAMYVLYEKNVYIPNGTSLEGAVVIVMAELTGTTLYSGTDSMLGFAIAAARQYVEQFEKIPLSDNPSNAEIFHWSKVITAASNDYEVPMVEYTQATQAQKDYVDYAYYASIMGLLYDTELNPAKLAVACESNDELALQKLILKTMLDESNVSYTSTASTQELFDLACKSEHFLLEEEFYSDVFEYDVTVVDNCEKLWFTMFSIAEQLDNGDSENVKILFNDGQLIGANETISVGLNPSLANETIKMIVNYNDNEKINETVTYTFNVHKVPMSDIQSDNSDDLSGKVEGFIEGIIPSDSEQGQEIIDKVMGAIDNGLSGSGDVADILTTFGVEMNDDGDGFKQETTSSNYVPTTSAKDSSGGYFDELLTDRYDVTEGETVTYTYDSVTVPTTATVVEKATQAVKENPEIIVAPTSLVVLGSFAGYMFTKKRKETDLADEYSEEN